MAAAVGTPDDMTGIAVVPLLVVKEGTEESDELREAIRETVGEEQGKPFRPRDVYFVLPFPETQSGNAIRRAIEASYTGEDLGDLSSLGNTVAIEKIEGI